jgi:hypothetical protein
MSTVNKYRFFCNTENTHVYTWNTTTPTVCPNNNTHTIDSQSITIVDTVSDERAVVVGKTPAGTYNNVSVTQLGQNTNPLDVAIMKPLTAFGEMATAKLSPIIQISNIYEDTNDQLFARQFYDPDNLNQSTITSSNAMVIVNCSSAANAYSSSFSQKIIMYRPGQGILLRFSGLVPNGGIQNTYQIMGYGSQYNGIWVGYKDTTFGVIRRTAGKPAVYKIAITTAATQSGNCTLTLDGIVFTIAVTVANGGGTSYTAFEFAKRNIYADANNNEKFWYAQNVQNEVIFTAFTPGPRTGAYSFDAGTTGIVVTGPTLVGQGVDYTEFFTPQSQFNVDTVDGAGLSGFTLDPTKGNVYQIQLQWLGFGCIVFSVEDQNGTSIPFHKIYYQNQNTVPSLDVPHGRIAFMTSVGATAAAQQPRVQYASAFAAVEGEIIRSFPKFSTANTVALIGTTERNILSLRGRREYNNHINLTEIEITSMSLAVTSGQQAVRFKVYLNPTISSSHTPTNYPNFKYINASYSSILLDNQALTCSGGVVVLQYIVTADNAIHLGLADIKLMLSGAETLTITATGDSNTVDVSITWVEDH